MKKIITFLSLIIFLGSCTSTKLDKSYASVYINNNLHCNKGNSAYLFEGKKGEFVLYLWQNNELYMRRSLTQLNENINDVSSKDDLLFKDKHDIIFVVSQDKITIYEGENIIEYKDDNILTKSVISDIEEKDDADKSSDSSKLSFMLD